MNLVDNWLSDICPLVAFKELPILNSCKKPDPRSGIRGRFTQPALYENQSRTQLIPIFFLFSRFLARGKSLACRIAESKDRTEFGANCIAENDTEEPGHVPRQWPGLNSSWRPAGQGRSGLPAATVWRRTTAAFELDRS